MTPMGQMPSFNAVREAILMGRTERLESENAHLREALENERKFSAATTASVAELKERIKRLEEYGDRIAMYTCHPSERFAAWQRVKEGA